jgi:shikimate kinase
VLATGGGTPCFFDNMELINEAGTSIFLDVPTTSIAQRLKRSTLNKRPLFSNLAEEQVKEKIQFLRSQRIPFYQKSHHKILGDEISVSGLINLIYS